MAYAPVECHPHFFNQTRKIVKNDLVGRKILTTAFPVSYARSLHKETGAEESNAIRSVSLIGFMPCISTPTFSMGGNLG